MNGPGFYTPPDVPGSIRAYDSRVRQLGVGQAGKTGYLGLVFCTRGGRTVIGEQTSEVPLCVQRAMYCDESVPGMAYAYVASVSGGILQGDRYRIDVTMRRGSAAHVTTQGATRIYGMDSDSATQMIGITLEDDSYLEFVPDQIIPYRNSRFYQRTNLTVHDGATLVCSEVVTPGRTAMGESFEYDVCHLRTRAENQDGSLRLLDAASLEPKRRDLLRYGVLGGHAVVGSVYVLTDRARVPGLYEETSSLLAGLDGVQGGASRARDDAAILVRLLGDRTDAVRDAVLRTVSCVRTACMGAPLAGVRKS